MDYHTLTTTADPSNANLPSSGQQSTAWLSARKVSVAGGEQGPRPHRQGRYSTYSRQCVVPVFVCLATVENISHAPPIPFAEKSVRIPEKQGPSNEMERLVDILCPSTESSRNF